jgi:hypothetical protein
MRRKMRVKRRKMGGGPGEISGLARTKSQVPNSKSQ